MHTKINEDEILWNLALHAVAERRKAIEAEVITPEEIDRFRTRLIKEVHTDV